MCVSVVPIHLQTIQLQELSRHLEPPQFNVHSRFAGEIGRESASLQSARMVEGHGIRTSDHSPSRIRFCEHLLTCCQ
jgi:hypothetical protein